MLSEELRPCLGVLPGIARLTWLWQVQCRSFRRDSPDDRRGDIEHNAEMQTIVIPPTRRRTRAYEVAVEFPSVQRIGKRTQTARQITRSESEIVLGRNRGASCILTSRCLECTSLPIRSVSEVEGLCSPSRRSATPRRSQREARQAAAAWLADASSGADRLCPCPPV